MFYKKKMLLNISQNLQENTCARASFLKACNFIKKETLAQLLSSEFLKNLCERMLLYGLVLFLSFARFAIEIFYPFLSRFGSLWSIRAATF